MLLVASYFFYMSWIPIFGFLIFGLTLFNWYWGKLLNKAGANRKHIFTVGIVINLLCLGYFKYANFFLDSIQTLLKPFMHSGSHAALNIILPLGISFFVFEFIHYLFEIYRGHKPINSFVLFALFASFFPTQIAGPIKRYPDFATQMQEEKKLSLSYFDEGIPLIILGVAKKLLLADNLAVVVDMMVNTHSVYGSLETWFIAYAFAMQIYFDFSGYTDIARGSALLFGYHIPLNFNLPYIANNMSDFWRRWHISLSSWLRDYLYIPMGGSKGNTFMTDRNLLMTMTLGGLWHGASWNFVVWGVFHGICLIVHRHFSKWRENSTVLRGFLRSRWFTILSVFLTFHVVCIGWVFFRIADISVALAMVKKMVLLSPIYTRVEAGHFLLLKPDLPVIVPLVILLVAGLLVATPVVGILRERSFFTRVPIPVKALYCALVIFSIVTFCPDNSTPFIYFQF